MDIYDKALCIVHQMEIMQNGKVHKKESVAGKGGKGKVVAIPTGEKYSYSQGIARQTIAFLDGCKASDDDLRNAFFDIYFLKLPYTEDCKLILPDTGTEEAKDMWKSISSRFFGVASTQVEPLLDEVDGLPIPYYSHIVEGSDKKSSALLDSCIDQPLSSFTRSNIVQVNDAPEEEDEDAEEPEDKPVNAPSYKLGFTVTFLTDDSENPVPFPKSYNDIAQPLDMRKFIACPPWMLNRLRSLSEMLLGKIPAVIDNADAADYSMNFVETANEYFSEYYADMYDGSDDDRKNMRKRIAQAPWRNPIVVKTIPGSDQTKREMVRYYSPEEKSLVDTYFVFPGYHDALEHCKDSYKKHRREVDSLLKPLIADSINFKIRGKLILAESVAKPKATRKRKAPASDGAAGSSGGGSSASTTLIDPEAFRAIFKQCFQEESEPLQKRLKLLMQHFEIDMEADGEAEDVTMQQQEEVAVAADAADAADAVDAATSE